MSYQAALQRLYNLSHRGIRLGLDRVRAASSRLGSPEGTLRCVQVGGTNGKGTVASLVAHTAQSAGLKTGLYTSPHMHRFAERIRIDNVEADADLLGKHLTRVLDLTENHPDLPLTFFEVATLTAFGVFAESEVDLAVLEVGLGGRLDATSIATPSVTAITSIGLDHTDLLGDTPALIAGEKAAIARPGIPLVVGPVQEDALEVIEAVALKVEAPLCVLGRDFRIADDITPPWPGTHQMQNTAVALEIIEMLKKQGIGVDREMFIEALVSAHWPGRFEIIESTPRFILDGAHNLEAVNALAESLSICSERPDVMIFGVLEGKPVKEMMDVLRPLVGQVVLVPPPISRALPPDSFAEPGDNVADSVQQGLELASVLAKDKGTIMVTGSLFTMAAIRGILLNEPTDPPIGL